MKNIGTFFKITAAALSVAFLASCAPKGESFNFSAMRTGVTVEVYGETFANGEKEKIKDLIISLENEFSLFKKDSFTEKFNSAAKNERLKPSERGEKILSFCEKAINITDGKFNPTVLPLSVLWKFYPDYPVTDFLPPTEAEINEVLNVRTGYDKIVRENGEIFKTADGIELDFGGVLKGYAADEAGKILLENGHTQGYVNVGGSSLFILSAESLGIKHPRKNDTVVTVNLKNEKNLSVSTSGDYERTYTYNGKTYCHVIDPETGKPADTGVAQVTVIGGAGVLCDAVTTALMLFRHSPEAPDETHSELIRGIKKLLSTDEFKSAKIFAVYVGDAHKQIITNADEKDFTLRDSEYEIIKI